MNTLSNNRLKSLAAYRQPKNCESDGLFVVEGIKMANEAIRAGWHIRVACATAFAWKSVDTEGLEVADELFEAKPEQIERLSTLRSPQGVWMLAERPCAAGLQLADVVDPETSPLVLALDGIQDPGNMGTMLRTADWFGVREVLCSADTVSCFNPKVVQATMGAIFRTRVTYCDLPEALSELAAQGFTICGATLDGENVFHATIGRPSLLVIGNEGHGVSSEVAAVISRRLTIPNVGGTCESLNASVAAAILMSVFYR